MRLSTGSIQSNRIQATFKPTPININSPEMELLTVPRALNANLNVHRLSKAELFAFKKRNSQLFRQSATFVAIKYSFVIVTIVSTIFTLVEINQLSEQIVVKEQIYCSNKGNNYPNTAISTFQMTNLTNSNDDQSDLNFLYKLKLPLVYYLSVVILIFFMAIFGRTLENLFLTQGFAFYLLVQLIAMLIISINSGVNYSKSLWFVYWLQIAFLITYIVMIFVTNQNKNVR